jgi:hypothetical protein
MPGSDKALVTFNGALPSGFALLCYILGAQLFLQPQPVPHIEDTLSYETLFFRLRHVLHKDRRVPETLSQP